MDYKTKIALAFSKIAKKIGLEEKVFNIYARLPFDVNRDADHSYIVERFSSVEKEFLPYSLEEKLLEKLLFARDLKLARKRAEFLDIKLQRQFTEQDASKLPEYHPLKDSYMLANQKIRKIRELKKTYEEQKSILQGSPSRQKLYQFMKTQFDLNAAIWGYDIIVDRMCSIAAQHGAT